MLLITVNEWLGPGRRMTLEQADRTAVTERHKGMVTRLNLSQAIEKINAYVVEYNKRYLLGLTISVISVSEIEDLSASHIQMAGLELIE